MGPKEGLVVRGWWVDLAATYSPTSSDAVPWALRGFTAEFGMGSGGAPALSATRSTHHPLAAMRTSRAAVLPPRLGVGGGRQVLAWVVGFVVVADGRRGRSGD